MHAWYCFLRLVIFHQSLSPLSNTCGQVTAIYFYTYYQRLPEIIYTAWRAFFPSLFCRTRKQPYKLIRFWPISDTREFAGLYKTGKVKFHLLLPHLC